MNTRTKWMAALLAVAILAGAAVVSQRRPAAPPVEEKPAEAAIELSADDV